MNWLFWLRPKYVVTVFMSADGWRFRIKAGNGEIVAQSEGYASPGNAERAAKAICSARLAFQVEPE